MSPRFKDKTVIITGASAGVGAACARAFAAQGANLVLIARRQSGLDQIAAELSSICRVYTSHYGCCRYCAMYCSYGRS